MKEIAMTRTLKTLSALVLGGMLVASSGCEDQECKAALTKATTANTACEGAAKAKDAEIGSLKARLTASEAALAATRKDLESAKAAAAAKPEEAAPAAPAKKGKKK
jgi:hypothetical protein